MEPESTTKNIYRRNAKCPDHKKELDCVKAYTRLIILHSQPVPLEKMNADCWGERLKTKMVILRRLAKLSSPRIKKKQLPQLKGIDPQKLMVAFNQEVQCNIKQIKLLKPKELLSLINCYSDFGTDLEKANGAMINQFVIFEKIRRTFYYNQKPDLVYNQPIPGGFCTLNNRIDTHRHSFMRMRKSLKKTPILFRLFKPIIKTMLKDPDSILGLIIKEFPVQKIKEQIFNTLISNSDRYKNP